MSDSGHVRLINIESAPTLVIASHMCIFNNVDIVHVRHASDVAFVNKDT
jgi:hypothetical protein